MAVGEVDCRLSRIVGKPGVRTPVSAAAGIRGPQLWNLGVAGFDSAVDDPHEVGRTFYSSEHQAPQGRSVHFLGNPGFGLLLLVDDLIADVVAGIALIDHLPFFRGLETGFLCIRTGRDIDVGIRVESGEEQAVGVRNQD